MFHDSLFHQNLTSFFKVRNAHESLVDLCGESWLLSETIPLQPPLIVTIRAACFWASPSVSADFHMKTEYVNFNFPEICFLSEQRFLIFDFFVQKKLFHLSFATQNLALPVKPQFFHNFLNIVVTALACVAASFSFSSYCCVAHFRQVTCHHWLFNTQGSEPSCLWTHLTWDGEQNMFTDTN